MIKLSVREMKGLSRILTICLCCVCAVHANAAGTIATTSGSNLTAYNPSNANNNQWASMTNVRYNSAPSAKADFGNCNALIMRCAQPKCTSGCSDISVAAAIVKGCVQSNKSCEQYGDDLVNYMSAQLVANSNAKANEQASALAQQQAAAQQQQIAQMQSEMQQQMYQMQQQMYQQQQESAQQLQEALAAQAAQSQQALNSVRAAATEAAQQNEAGISNYQQEAINRGISTDVLERQKVTGQILTEIENAETSLATVKKAMNSVFDYAKCDARGNNCSGPKRIKKFRELASDFLDPYDNVVDKIYQGIDDASFVGVDVSDVMMMLDNSCQKWAQYLCSPGSIEYSSGETAEKGTPYTCPAAASKSGNYSGYDACNQNCAGKPRDEQISCANNCKKNWCQPCKKIKMLSNKDDVYAGWVDVDYSNTTTAQTVVACSDNAIKTNGLLGRRAKNRNGVGIIDLDNISNWLSFVEPNKFPEGKDARNYCYAEGQEEILRSAIMSKSVQTQATNGNNKGLCKNRSDVSDDNMECEEINPVYALCDVHVFNIGELDNIKSSDSTNSSRREEMKEIIALKTTVITQQLYKQYEYLAATFRRLKIMLEKSVLMANLEAAGAKSENGTTSGGLLGGSRNEDSAIHLVGAENCNNKLSSDSVYSCLQTNISLIISSATSNTKKACQQLKETINTATTWSIEPNESGNCKNIATSCTKNNVAACAQELNAKIIQEKEKKSEKQQARGLYYGG